MPQLSPTLGLAILLFVIISLTLLFMSTQPPFRPKK